MNEQMIEVGDVITWAIDATYGVVTRISEDTYRPGTHYWCEEWYKDEGCTILEDDNSEAYLHETSAILVRKGINNIPITREQISAYDQPTDFKVGDNVYCLLYGEGVVEMTDLQGDLSIWINFEKGSGSYTHDGRFYTDCERTLFFSKPSVLGGGRCTPTISKETQEAIDLLKQQGYTVSKD